VVLEFGYIPFKDDMTTFSEEKMPLYFEKWRESSHSYLIFERNLNCISCGIESITIFDNSEVGAGSKKNRKEELPLAFMKTHATD
jgi:hypothetical protein